MPRKQNPRIKAANEVSEYTPEQVLELKRCKDDVKYFCRKYVKIQHPVKGSVPFDLYPYQEVMLDMYQKEQYTIVLSARQTGKSITSAIYLLWFAMFHKDKTILIASNKNAGAMEMVYRIRFAYEELPNWLKAGVEEDGWNKHNIGFDNGSRIISTATAPESGRGLAISLLFLDEFAFVAPNIQDEFWTSISPTLSTGGSCIVTSTPNGDTNLFAQLWRTAICGSKTKLEYEDEESGEEMEGIVGFAPLQVKWDEPPGRGEVFKKKQIAVLGKLKWRQEYECEFLSSDALLIDTMVLNEVEKRMSTDPKIVNEFTFWSEIRQGETYLVGVDPSTGSGLDFSVIEVFHFPSMIQVAELRENTMSSGDLYRKLKWVVNLMDRQGCTSYFSVENNGVGEGVISLYMNDDEPPTFAEFISDDVSSRMGMNANARTKIKACLNIKEMIERGKLFLNSHILLTEFKSFVRKRGSYEAQDGSTDDCVTACLVVVRILEEIAPYEQDAFDKLYNYDNETGKISTKEYDDVMGTDPEEDDHPMPLLF